MRFNPDLNELVPKEQLDAAFGGDFEYEFEPTSYWTQIMEYVIIRLLCVSSTYIIDSACGIAPDGTRLHKEVPQVNAPLNEKHTETVEVLGAIAVEA